VKLYHKKRKPLRNALRGFLVVVSKNEITTFYAGLKITSPDIISER